jgi:hypothetical protein
MAFDAKTFLANAGQGASVTNSIGAGFGVPSCMLGLASDVLGLIPSPVLLGMREAIAAGNALADAALKRINSYIRDVLGISLFPDRDGFFGYFSDTSRFGLDLLGGGFLNALGAFVGFAATAAQAANDLANKFASAKECLEQFQEYLEYSGGNAANKRMELANLRPADYQSLIDSQFGIYMQQADIAKKFIIEADAQLEAIDKILLDRTLDPTLDPEFEQDPVTESVFRLEAGPPRSRSGKFVLSIDGLYYDSQVSGVEPALLELAEREDDLRFEEGGFYNGDLWRLEFDPSLGGRIIDDSKGVTKFYDQDELLLSLEGQKDRRVFDVSSELQELIDDEASQAVIDNMRQVMLSETAQFQDRINKRKKQIELAVKVPTFLGKGPQYTPGNVPVNDFSYLAGSNFLMDIKDQRSIVLDQADVTGVVLPLEVKYTEKIP